VAIRVGTADLPFAPKGVFSRTVLLGVEDTDRLPLSCVAAAASFIVILLARQEVFRSPT
jgi:hypothetical protein